MKGNRKEGSEFLSASSHIAVQYPETTALLTHLLNVAEKHGDTASVETVEDRLSGTSHLQRIQKEIQETNFDNPDWLLAAIPGESYIEKEKNFLRFLTDITAHRNRRYATNPVGMLNIRDGILNTIKVEFEARYPADISHIFDITVPGTVGFYLLQHQDHIQKFLEQKGYTCTWVPTDEFIDLEVRRNEIFVPFMFYTADFQTDEGTIDISSTLSIIGSHAPSSNPDQFGKDLRKTTRVFEAFIEALYATYDKKSPGKTIVVTMPKPLS